jgi:fluoride exporter
LAYLWLSLGGLAGTLARYFMSGWISRVFPGFFPLGTLAVNALGCFLIGIFAAIAEQKGLSFSAKLLLITGFCGAFTTFSALIFESWYLVRQQGVLPAFLNLFLSLTAGFICFALGFWIIQQGRTAS